MNPLLRLLQLDCYEYATEHNGIIKKEILEEIVVNPTYQPLFDLYFGERSKEDKKVKFSSQYLIPKLQGIEELNAATIKREKIKAKAGDFIHRPAYREIEKIKLFEPFYRFGIDPHTFLKTLFQNLNKKALKLNQKSYLFNLEHLLDESPLVDSMQELKKEGEIVDETFDIEEEKSSDASSISTKTKQKLKTLTNSDIPLKTQEIWEQEDTMWLNGDTNKFLLPNILKNALHPSNEKEQKNLFDYLKKRILIEENLLEPNTQAGFDAQKKLIKNAGAWISKLIKNHPLEEVVRVCKLAQSKTNAPMNIRSFMIHHLSQTKTVDEFDY